MERMNFRRRTKISIDLRLPAPELNSPDLLQPTPNHQLKLNIP